MWAATGRTYRVGETVDVFSKGEGAWVSARVTAVDAATGTVSVKWGERNQKDIAPAFFDEYLRPSAPADFQPKPKPPMTVVSLCVRGTFIGKVIVFSVVLDFVAVPSFSSSLRDLCSLFSFGPLLRVEVRV